MRIAEIVKLFVGSCVVYYVVAACSAYSGEEPPASTSSSSSSGDGASPAPTSTSPVPNALAEGHKSGTRLKLRYWEGSDGSRQFIDFYDSQLKVECQVDQGPRTTDDKVRCVPAVTGTLLFSDAACTSIFGYAVGKTNAPPAVAGATVTIQSRQFREYYSVGVLKSAPTAAVYFKEGFGGQGSGCSQINGFTGTSHDYYAVGTPLGPTTFVEMTIKNE